MLPNPVKSRHLWHLKKNIYIQFKNYFTPHVQYLPSFPPQLTLRANSWHWTCLGIQFYTSPIALTRGIYSLLGGGTTLETRGTFQGAYKLFVGHGTVIWLVCGMKSTKRLVCLCRRRTHAEMSHRLLHSWKLAGRNQEIWYSNRGWVAIPTSLTSWYYKLSSHA